MRRIVLLAVIACWAALACAARANITYSYIALNSANQSGNFTVSQGGSITLSVYLDEAITSSGPGPTSSLIVQDGGLFSAAARVTQTSTGSATAITNSTFTAPNVTGAAGNVGDRSATSTGFGWFTNGTNPAFTSGGTAFGTAPSSIYLIGTVTISAGANAAVGSTATYQTTAFNTTGGNTTTQGTTAPPPQSFYDLDFTNNNGATFSGALDNPLNFTVTVTPEPNGMVLSGLAGCVMVGGLGYAGYRRRKAQLLKLDAAA